MTVYAIIAQAVIPAIVAIFAGVLGLVIISSVSFKKLEESAKKNQDKKKNEAKKGVSEKTSREEENNNFLDRYNEKKIQRILKEHKIKKINEPVIVDFSEKYKIKECPAYIWRDKNNFYLLLLEKQTRKITVPLSTFKYIDYEPGVTADVEKDYKNFQESSFIGKMFGKFLPSYHNGQGREIRLSKKNLYKIAPDIRFTNKSARNLMKILDLNVNIKHSALNQEEYAQYYQIFYQYNILWKDEVLTIEEYENKIKLQLKKIADSTIEIDEYRGMVMKFMKYRWITDEYARFFVEYKEKMERSRLEQKNKR